MLYFLAVAALLLIVAGIAGCILPVLPGPLLAYAGLLCCWGTGAAPFGTTALAGWGIAVAVVTAADYFLPGYVTRWFGGSRASSAGATIGLLAGLFFTPVGMLAGSFLGAVIGELLRDSRDVWRAFRAGCGAFLAFVLGTGLKLAVVLGMALPVVRGLWHLFAA